MVREGFSLGLHHLHQLLARRSLRHFAQDELLGHEGSQFLFCELVMRGVSAGVNPLSHSLAEEVSTGVGGLPEKVAAASNSRVRLGEQLG